MFFSIESKEWMTSVEPMDSDDIYKELKQLESDQYSVAICDIDEIRYYTIFNDSSIDVDCLPLDRVNKSLSEKGYNYIGYIFRLKNVLCRFFNNKNVHFSLLINGDVVISIDTFRIKITENDSVLLEENVNLH